MSSSSITTDNNSSDDDFIIELPTKTAKQNTNSNRATKRKKTTKVTKVTTIIVPKTDINDLELPTQPHRWKDATILDKVDPGVLFLKMLDNNMMKIREATGRVMYGLRHEDFTLDQLHKFIGLYWIFIHFLLQK